MKNLNGKRFAYALFVLFIIGCLVVGLITGATISDFESAVKVAYKSLGLIVLIATFFIAHAWRWRIFRGWLVPFPDLGGTWEGTLQTTWSDPQTGLVPPPITTILTIRQSFIRISCVMRTEQMTSRSFMADFWLEPDEQIRNLGYSYHSSPIATVRDHSAPHDGTAIFELVGSPVTKLKGSYWTGRKTTGTVELTFRTAARLDDFPDDLIVEPTP